MSNNKQQKCKKTNNIYNQRGVTLIALVVTIVILIILAAVSINMLVGENGIIAQAQRAAQNTKQAEGQSQTGLDALSSEISTITGNSYNEDKKVNAPQLLTGMTPIKFTDPAGTTKGETITTLSTDESWYNYENKNWANAQTQDGSMWVWIPRYAYKINTATQTTDVVFLIGDTDTYYEGEGENRKIQTAKRATSADEIVDTTTGYTVHPAFTNESTIGYANGGWDKELTGIWVAKFEAGYASGNNTATVKASSVNYTQDTVWVAPIETEAQTEGENLPARNWLDGIYYKTTTSIKYPTFQGVTYSMNYININDAYNISQVLTEDGNIYGLSSNGTDSHLMKNSEWGAVTYLGRSRYGLGSIDITVNNITLNSGDTNTTKADGNEYASVYAVTGCTSGSTTNGQNITTISNINSSNGVFTWNHETGTTASSSGTIYGVYDMSGGTWERTAGYVANGNGNLKTYGKSLAYESDGTTLKTASTKYTTVYPTDSTVDKTGATIDDASKANYSLNTKIYGDSIRETSTAGVGGTSWKGDCSYFSGLHDPFLLRGGNWVYGSDAGLSTFNRTNGYTYYYGGFRSVLVAR